MNFYILGAGKPFIGVLPTSLKKINNSISIIDWQIKSILKSIKKVNLFFITGYRSKLLEKNLPKNKIKFIYNKNWADTSVISSFSKINFTDKDFFVSYSDTIFDTSIYSNIVKSSNNFDLVVAVDFNWKERYPNRTEFDLKIAEKIYIEDKYAEFTGLIYFKKNTLLEFKKINLKGLTSLIELINIFKDKNYKILFFDVNNLWAEFNLPQDVAKFFIKSKASTLEKLNIKSMTFKVPKQYYFKVQEFKKNKNLFIKIIQKKFKNNKIIIRSSSFSEDSWKKSNAGKYLSIPNIKTDNRSLILKNINKVINSYGNLNLEKDEVLIQQFIQDIKISGVLFTCTLNTGSNYYHLNYDNDKYSTTGVTSGSKNNLEKLVIYKPSLEKIKNKYHTFYEFLLNIRKIENLLIYNKLDIEFLLTNKNIIYILQIRPITVNYDIKIFEEKFISSYLFNSYKNFNNKYFYSNMSDWNPAEIIGLHPKPLASDIYEYLVTNDVWSLQRSEVGYSHIKNKKLLKFIIGRPYVIIDHSFRSFIPNNLNNKTKFKLYSYYKRYLKNNPHLHDKIEFEIVFTIWTPDLKNELIQKKKEIHLTHKEINLIDEELKKITLNILERLDNDISLIKKLSIERNKILNSNKLPTSKIKNLLDSTKIYGTLPFAHLARACFTSMTILKFMLKTNIMSKKRYDNFLSSINSVNKTLLIDRNRYFHNKINLNKLKLKYGHLREGTYEISNNSYADNPSKYLSKINNKKSKEFKFIFNQSEKKVLSEFISSLSPTMDIEYLIKFLGKSIEYRELSKFEFTKNINAIFKLILKDKNLKKIEKNKLSFLKINEILNFKKSIKYANKIQDLIKKREKNYELQKSFELSDILFENKDLLFFKELANKPNFITQNKVEGNLLFLNKELKYQKLTKKIVVIDHADPGYDWIFSHDISGLITKYGGANSHMAIRSAELNLAASIGVGSIIFNEILNASKIYLNCENKSIKIIE